jgi:hypothetical protein
MVMLKRVGVMSVAKIIAVLSAIVGLIEGILFASLGSMMGDMLSGTPVGMLGMFGYTAIIMFPVGGAISGFVGGAIIALLYNLVAGKIGGIEMDLVRVQGAVTPPPTQPQPASIPTAAPIPTQSATIPAPAPVVTAPPAADAVPARFCSHCGAKISATAIFCRSCGARQA